MPWHQSFVRICQNAALLASLGTSAPAARTGSTNTPMLAKTKCQKWVISGQTIAGQYQTFVRCCPKADKRGCSGIVR